MLGVNNELLECAFQPKNANARERSGRVRMKKPLNGAFFISHPVPDRSARPVSDPDRDWCP